MTLAGRASHVGKPQSDWRELGASDVDTDDLHNVQVADDEINIVVVHIRRLARCASLEFALGVGAVIIHHFYDGRVDTWRSRGPKNDSFRKLARHPALPLSAGALYRCVALYELCERLHAPSRWEHLGASHLRIVLKLPPPLQEQMLAKANSERWTVRALQEVVAEQTAIQNRGGRRADPPIKRGLASVRRCLADYRQILEQVGYLPQKDVESSRLVLEETKKLLDDLSQLLVTSDSTSKAGDEAAANVTPVIPNYE